MKMPFEVVKYVKTLKRSMLNLSDHKKTKKIKQINVTRKNSKNPMLID